MRTLNDFNLKKGDILFLYGNWNGVKQSPIDFFIQEYNVYSIGKKRCYLLYDTDINTKEMFLCNANINIALTMDEAILRCSSYINEYIESEREGYQWRIDKWGSDKHYCEIIKHILNNIYTAPTRILLNPYTKKDQHVLGQFSPKQ